MEKITLIIPLDLYKQILPQSLESFFIATGDAVSKFVTGAREFYVFEVERVRMFRWCELWYGDYVAAGKVGGVAQASPMYGKPWTATNIPGWDSMWKEARVNVDEEQFRKEYQCDWVKEEAEAFRKEYTEAQRQAKKQRESRDGPTKKTEQKSDPRTAKYAAYVTHDEVAAMPNIDEFMKSADAAKKVARDLVDEFVKFNNTSTTAGATLKDLKR